MFTIKKCDVDKAEKVKIDIDNWNTNNYTVDVFAQIAYDDTGFNVKFTVMEENPVREKTEHFQPVHEDSCVEFFVNFTPETSDRYLNLETNANGVMNVSFRKDRYESVPLLKEEVEGFNITPQIFDNYWTTNYKVGFDFIKKYYPDFDIDTCEYVTGNLYKCCDAKPILLTHFPIGHEKPDFHRPEYFQKIPVEK